jgi:hypothetical protein
MKYIGTLAVSLFISLLAFAQNENCKLIIDGKEFANRSAITKEQALKFCTVQQRDTRMSSTLQPVAYEWVYTVKGEIFKGNMQDCSKLTSLIGKQKTHAILFIDKIKYKDFAGICDGQFALTIE